ncbi:MAG TPA: MASE1 domain-containing protein [Steroidobacteraceae bacterium]|nr:MASE1 domain-containing protein [Steroidobacteraceae bacterium]
MPPNEEAIAPAGARARAPAVALDLGRALVVFAAILAIGTIDLEPQGWVGHVAIWLLSSGIALAAVFRWGRVQYLSIYAASVLVDVLNRRPLVPALLAGVGLPAGVFATVWLLRRYGFRDTFERGRDMPLFIAAALAGMAIPAAVGVGTYAAWSPIDPLDNNPWARIDLLRWWLNDFMGVLILAPLLVSLRWKSLQPIIRQPASSGLFLFLLIAVVTITIAVPAVSPASQFARQPILLASTILVVAICLRSGLVPAAAAGLILTGTAVFCTVFDVGIMRGMSAIPALVMLWTYVCAMSLPVLLLTWLLAEQRRLERSYEQLFDACPQSLWVHDRASLRFLVVNAACERQYGYSRGELLQSTIALLSPADEDQTLGSMLTADLPQPLELRHQTRDGTLISIEAWFQPIDYCGHPAWLVFAFDVSERKALERALVTAISGEQRRLGQDLHDGLAQDLTVASILTGELSAQFEERALPIFPELKQLSERIASALVNARSIAHGLSPLTGSNGDLGAALALLAKASTVGDTLVEASTHMESDLRLTFEGKTHLYRIAQEALQNALKHADARRVEIRLTVRLTKVVLEVMDDGRGIRREDARGSGFGTNTMRYRSSAIGGLLTMRGRADGGTVVSCQVPQPSEAARQGAAPRLA